MMAAVSACFRCLNPCRKQRPPASTARQHLKRASELINSNKFEEALVAINSAASPNGTAVKDAQTLRLRALVLTALGQHNEAVQDIDVLIAAEPSDTDLLTQRAGILFRMEENDRALVDLTAAIGAQPSNCHRGVLRQRPASTEKLCTSGNVLPRFRRHLW